MSARPATLLASAVLLFWLAVAALSPLLPWDPNHIAIGYILQTPSANHWMGFDDAGREVSIRVLASAGVSLGLALSVVLSTCVVGTAVGLYAGWRGGFTDLLLARVIDVFLAFPGLLLAIALSGILGPGIANIWIALTVVGWVGFARLARAQTLSLKHRDHVTVARALGTPALVIVRKHVLPLLAAPIIVEATFAVAAVVIAEAGLSFLGLGIQPPEPSWGSMIRDGTRYLLIAPHLVIMPGIALISVVISVNVLGDRLRDYWQRSARGHDPGSGLVA